MKKLILPFIALSLAAGCKKNSEKDLPLPVQDPATATTPVSAATVRLGFQQAGVKDVHPRLLFTAAELEQIKTGAQSDAFATPTYNDVISRANALLAAPLLDYGLDAANLRINSIHTFSNEQAPYLVLAYQFTRDRRYADRAWAQLEKLCTYPDWGANRHFLDAGIAAKAVALCYDGLYDYLSEEQKRKLYTTVRAYVLQPGKFQIDNNSGVFKWYLSNDNWNGICHGGMIMAALATYEMDSTFNSNVISVAANGMLRYIQSLEPDGASEEGMSYWSYGLTNTFLSLEAMKRCLTSTFGLTEQNGIKKTGWFPYLVSGPIATSTFGDDYIYAGRNNKFLSYFWFSKFFNDASLAKAHYDACMSINSNQATKMNGWLDLLFYKKDLVNQGGSFNLPLAGYVKGIEYLYLQEQNNDNALYIGMHAGDNASSHGHLDAGSFFIQGLGENWAQGNLGLENPYPADYFSITNPQYGAAPTNTATTSGRFYYYRVKTEGKNCLVFNPDARPEQNPTGVATVVNSANDGTGGYHVIDLAGNYSRDVNAYRRGIKLNRAGKWMSVQDEFVPKISSTVYWLMHTPAVDGITISADGKTATMVRNGKTLYARIAAPATAVFQKVSRSATAINYLTETAPIFGTIMSGKNSANPFYGKLQIKLAGMAANTPATLRVDFLTDNAIAAPALVPLTNWTTSN